MPDAVEVSEDGRAAFMVADGQPAWHGLGEVKSEPVNAEEGMKAAHLDKWDVRKLPIYAAREDRSGMSARTVEFKDEDGNVNIYGVVRNNPFTGAPEGLGTVGKLWTPVQNEELGELMDYVAGESGAKFHTMGSLEGGRAVFMSMKLPEGVLVGGEDAVDLYFIGANRHDGQASLWAFVSPVRPVCKNTVDMALRAAKRKWSMRHVGDVQGKVQQIREGLEMTYKYAKAFENVANGLLADPFTEGEMDELLKELIPDPESEKEGWVNRAVGQRSSIMNLFNNSDTTEFGRGTKWAAYNAVTEYADWYRPGSPERRAREALGIGVNQHLKAPALKALVAEGNAKKAFAAKVPA